MNQRLTQNITIGAYSKPGLERGNVDWTIWELVTRLRVGDDRTYLSHSDLNTINMKHKLEIYGSFLIVFSERQTKHNNSIRRLELVGCLPKKRIRNN